MRKYAKYLAMCLAFCFALTGCDAYAGQRPTAYKHSRWRAETPNIYFDVDEKKYLKTIGSVTYGKIDIDGVVTEIMVDFSLTNVIHFRNMSIYVSPEEDELNHEGYFEWPDDCLFSGKCEFSPQQCVVKITYNKGFLDDSIKQIVFKREEIPD